MMHLAGSCKIWICNYACEKNRYHCMCSWASFLLRKPVVTWYGALLMRKNGWTLNLNKKEMDTIFQEVQESVSKWEALAKNTGIPSVQRRLMEAAFHLK